MLRRPCFKPHLRVEIVAGEGVFLLSETSQAVLQGRLYELVAPFLDGRPLKDLAGQLKGRISRAEFYYTLGQLERKGYLAEREDSLPPGAAGLYSMQGVDSQAAARRLAERPVTIRAVGEVDVAPFRVLLQSLLVGFADDGEWTVVVTDSYLRGDLQTHNEEGLRSGRPWLLVRTGGSQVWLGPLFRPGHTGCWVCLADRMRANSPVAGYLEAKRGNDGDTFVDRCCSPATLQAGWGLAATAVASWIVGADLARLDGKVQTLDVLTGDTKSHTLIRQPSCPGCGERGIREGSASPVTLQRCAKAFTHDGGYRAVSPEETLGRFGRHVSPITGAVSMLERDGTNGDGLLHVYQSGNNVARRPESWARLRSDLRNSTSGKGATESQAKASALCEGLERYSAVYRGDEPRRRARFIDLGDEAVHPGAVLLFSDKQYREREARNAHRPAHDEIPLPFDPEAAIDWSPIWSLSRGATRWLPTAFCYFHAPHEPSETFCWSDSNGNAAGNTREEAILQGFLELVERDSVALWWYNRVRRPAVDLDSFAEPYLLALRDFLASRHRDLWALDLTSDLGVPAFVAISRRTDGGMEQIMLGFGAHLDARLGLLRAVTEKSQIHGLLLDAPADQLPTYLTAKQTIEWLGTATVENQPYLLPLEGPSRVASSYPPCATDDLLHDVLACQGAGGAAWHGNAGSGPDPARTRPAGRQGGRPRAAAFLGPLRAWPALRRSRSTWMAGAARVGGTAQSDPHVPLTRIAFLWRADADSRRTDLRLGHGTVARRLSLPAEGRRDRLGDREGATDPPQARRRQRRRGDPLLPRRRGHHARRCGTGGAKRELLNVRAWQRLVQGSATSGEASSDRHGVAPPGSRLRRLGLRRSTKPRCWWSMAAETRATRPSTGPPRDLWRPPTTRRSTTSISRRTAITTSTAVVSNRSPRTIPLGDIGRASIRCAR